MYAMDQTMHFEHRADEERRTRWELRRPDIRSSAPDISAPDAVATAIDTSPTHEFLD